MTIESIQYDHASGLWWPTNTDPKKGYEYMIHRVTDIDVAVKHCKKTAVAVQAGGNIGMWPRRLAKFFETVHTFEPVPVIYGALESNVRHLPGVIAYNQLLHSEERSQVHFSVRSGGVSRVVKKEDEPGAFLFANLTTIDAMKLPCCDAIFLDVEGHEMEALRGAMETIEKYRPVITVEVWDKNAEAYWKFFDKLGYTRVAKVHMDYVFSPRG